MADIDASLSWRMQQDGYLMQINQLRTENAKLREQYEAVIADYRSEVAKLRELLLHMYTCMGNVDADGNHECFSCEYEGAECDFADRMRGLGVVE